MSKLRPTPAFMKRLEFLFSGRLYLKDAVKSITFSYPIRGEGSSGIRWAREREKEILRCRSGLGSVHREGMLN